MTLRYLAENPPESRIAVADYRAALRADFHSFLVRAFGELNGGAAFMPGWHIEVMSAKLAALREGRARRLILNVPPRHLKSLAASVALPAWLLGHDPTLSIISATYAQELADKFARDALCHDVFGVVPVGVRDAARFAAAADAGAGDDARRLSSRDFGRRRADRPGTLPDVILIDDPLKPAEAMSESRRGAVNDWFDGTLYSRLNDKTRGAIVLVMQRLHEDDLAGHLLKQEGWDVLSFPAIAEADELHVAETPFGVRRFQR